MTSSDKAAVMNELVDQSLEIIKLKDQRRELVGAMKDAHSHIADDALRTRIGNLIAKAEGGAA